MKSDTVINKSEVKKRKCEILPKKQFMPIVSINYGVTKSLALNTTDNARV